MFKRNRGKSRYIGTVYAFQAFLQLIQQNTQQYVSEV